MNTENLVVTITERLPASGSSPLHPVDPDLIEIARATAVLLKCQAWPPGALERLLHRLTIFRSLLGNPPEAAWITPPKALSAIETMALRVRDWHQRCPHARRLEEAVTAYKTEYANFHRSAKTVEAKNVLERFSAAAGPVFVEEADPVAWLDSLEPIKEKTRKVYHSHVWCFLNWCVQRHFAPFNPCLPYIGNCYRGGDPIEIVAPSDLARLLETAIRWRPHWIRILVLLFFVGLRPSRETFELTWRDISQDEVWNALIKRETVKTHRERLIELSPVVMAWLRLFVPANLDGKIAPMTYANWKERRHFLYRKAGVKPPGFNAARHSFESAAINETADRREVANHNDHSMAVQGRAYFRHLPPGTGARYGIYPPEGWKPNLSFDVTQVWGRSQAPPPELVMVSQPTAESWDQFRAQAPAAADKLLLSVIS